GADDMNPSRPTIPSALSNETAWRDACPGEAGCVGALTAGVGHTHEEEMLHVCDLRDLHALEDVQRSTTEQRRLLARSSWATSTIYLPVTQSAGRCAAH